MRLVGLVRKELLGFLHYLLTFWQPFVVKSFDKSTLTTLLVRFPTC